MFNRMKHYLSALRDNTYLVDIIMIGLVIAVVVCAVLYVRNKLTLKNRDCNALEKKYKSFPTLASVPSDGTGTYGHNLRDYYIKSAYNCCNPGTMADTWVDTCALKNAIKQGARVLDFAIYSVNNSPVIASSTSDSYDVKDTYNSVPFKTAMEAVNNFAFSGSSCPNSNDPIILHFRIMTKHQPIMATIAKTLHNVLGRRLLGSKYSHENQGNNLGAMPLRNFLGKVIIAVDRSNPIFEHTSLDEYVNISSGSAFMRCMRDKQIKFTHDTQELITFNKKNMTLVLPDLGDESPNPSAALTMQYGCQMNAMSYQFPSANLDHYNKLFADAGHAFILKPADLRFVPTTIAVPPLPPASHSARPRESKTDFYNFVI